LHDFQAELGEIEAERLSHRLTDLGVVRGVIKDAPVGLAQPGDEPPGDKGAQLLVDLAGLEAAVRADQLPQQRGRVRDAQRVRAVGAQPNGPSSGSRSMTGFEVPHFRLVKILALKK
jgi:hypothetical protein